MTPEKFFNLLSNHSLLDEQSALELKELIREYPYFQAARMLLAKNHHLLNHEAYPLSLRLAAAYSPDRSRLKSLIDNTSSGSSLKFAPESTHYFVENTAAGESSVGAEGSGNTAQPIEPASVDAVAPEISHPSHYHSVEEENNEIPGSAESATGQSAIIDQIRSRLVEAGIYHEAETIAPSTLLPEQDPTPVLSRSQLIDKFIRDEPRISIQRREFYHANDMARQSTSLPEDIVSETLARIYEEQGHTEIALKIYQRLSLLFPEKRSYFAARIEELEKKRK